jgi:tetratricopeptide (TPR) repeat protein
MLERTVRVLPPAARRAALGDAAPEIAKLMPELRRLFPDIPPPLELPPEQQRRFLFNAYQEFVERATRVSPIVAVLEDLHWADDSTLHLLHHLAPQLSGIGLLVVGTYRDVELDVARPFAAVLESLLRERRAARLPLKRLPESDVAAMLDGLGGEPAPDAVVAAVYQETEGNPFFVEEVFQHLSEQGQVFDTEGHWRPDLRLDELQVPEGVRLVIGRRLERLTDDARRALATGAVIGRSFDLAVLEAAGDVKGEALLNALEEAERAQVLAVAPGARVVRYTFAHELFRQTLVGAVSLPRRQRLHLRIAEGLETVYAGSLEPHAASLAHHLYQAGAAADGKKAVRYLTLAGDRAAAAAAFDEALREYETALSLPEGTEPPARADLRVRRGHVLRSLGRGAEAIKDWEDALPIYEASADVEAVARLCRDLSYQFRAEARYADLADVCQRGLRCVGPAVTGPRCRLLAAAGLGKALTGDYEAGTALLDQAQTMAEELADPQLLGQALSNQATRHYYYGEFSGVASVGVRGAETLRHVGDLWELALVLGHVQLSLVCSGRFDQAASVDQELRPLAVRLGHRIPLILSDLARATQALALTGELDALEEAGRRGIDDWRRAGPWSWMGYYYVAVAHFLRGRWDEALQSLDQAIRLQPSRAFRGYVWGTVVLVKAYAAQPDALASYCERGADLPAPGRRAFLGDWLHLLLAVDALAVLGERERAYELYPALEIAESMLRSL